MFLTEYLNSIMNQTQIKKLKKISSLNVKIIRIIELKLRILNMSQTRLNYIIISDYNIKLNVFLNRKYAIVNNINSFNL